MIDGVLQGNTYLTLATVCPSGAPWSVPVKYAVHENVIYWRSAETTVHSQNITKDPRVSISIFDIELRQGQDERQAFYLQSTATKLNSEESEKILTIVGHKFSNRDTSSPIYSAPIGRIDETKTTDNRFYNIYEDQNGVSA